MGLGLWGRTKSAERGGERSALGIHGKLMK